MEVIFFIGILCMVLKDNVIGEVRLSCSNMTEVATISKIVLWDALVLGIYGWPEVRTNWTPLPNGSSNGKAPNDLATEIR
jgi:hypothetical protein